MTWKLVATCPEESKVIVAQEAESLGAKVEKLGFRAVYFEVPDLETFYKMHLQITTASHLFWIVKSFAAKDAVGDSDRTFARSAVARIHGLFSLFVTFPRARARGFMLSSATRI